MSKAIILVLALVACTFSMSAFEQIKSVVETDGCGIHGMESIKPKIENKLAELKANPQNVEAKTELLALVEDVVSVYESCGIEKKVDPMVGDAVEHAGISFMLASNCFKDVGIVLLLADSIVEDPTNLTNDVIVAIFEYILGKQGVADCSQFYNYII